MLAGWPQPQRQDLMDQLRARIDNRIWPKVEDGILRAVDDVKTLGFCLNIGEWTPDVSSVAVQIPPTDDSGDPPLACSYGGPSFLLSRDFLKTEIGPRLVDLARILRG